MFSGVMSLTDFTNTMWLNQNDDKITISHKYVLMAPFRKDTISKLLIRRSRMAYGTTLKSDRIEITNFFGLIRPMIPFLNHPTP
jgi:hypothetical protein